MESTRVSGGSSDNAPTGRVTNQTPKRKLDESLGVVTCSGQCGSVSIHECPHRLSQSVCLHEHSVKAFFFSNIKHDRSI